MTGMETLMALLSLPSLAAGLAALVAIVVLRRRLGRAAWPAFGGFLLVCAAWLQAVMPWVFRATHPRTRLYSAEIEMMQWLQRSGQILFAVYIVGLLLLAGAVLHGRSPAPPDAN